MKASVLDTKLIRDLVRARGRVPRITTGAGQQIDVASMPCHLGGQRWFLICPRCERRVMQLHAMADGGVGCRRCVSDRCGYPATRNLSREERLRERRAVLTARLGAESRGFPGGVPPRPARMWERTYHRLWVEIMAIDKELVEIARQQLRSFHARPGTIE